MIHWVCRTALIGALVLLLPVSDVPAQPKPAGAIVINYVEPTDPAHRPIYDRLRERRVLEDFRDFLSPLKLPQPLEIKVQGCKGVINAWYSSRSIAVCYEYIAWIRKLAAQGAPIEGISPADAVMGPFVDVMLHELSHAVFDMLNIPLFGREEDAADQLAAFLLLQFGKDVARRTITGTALFFRHMAESQQQDAVDFASVHGLPAQRFYNVLCIAYGWDRDLFADFVRKGLLPQHRAAGCPWEYKQVAHAFKTLIGPHIDAEIQKKVQARRWLRSDDGK
jgi:hypothetical protein